MLFRGSYRIFLNQRKNIRWCGKQDCDWAKRSPVLAGWRIALASTLLIKIRRFLYAY